MTVGAFGVWTCPTCNVTYEETDGHECVASDLAARVSELEAENAALRKCVEAADRIDGFAVAGSVLLEQRGYKRDADEVMEYVKAYRAARAEVDK